MNRLVMILGASIWLVTCTEPSPLPPPECGENEHVVDSTCVCNDGYARDEDGNCVIGDAPPPSPPLTCALPDAGRGRIDCYVKRERAGIRRDKPVSSTGILREMMFIDQELVSTSRNFFEVSRTCGDHLGSDSQPFHITPIELEALSYIGFRLHDGGRELRETPFITHPSMLSFIGEGNGSGRLEKAHRNCDENDADDPWCRHTGVFKPLLSDFRTNDETGVAAHMEVIRDIDGRAGQHGFDGILAWCKAQ